LFAFLSALTFDLSLTTLFSCLRFGAAHQLHACLPLAGFFTLLPLSNSCSTLLLTTVVQDAQAERESQKAKQKAQSKQAMVKKVLEDQLSQIQQEKNAAKEQKKKEATELKDSIRQYEEEEFQKWQQHKEQQAKTKQMYSQQASRLNTQSLYSVEQVTLTTADTPRVAL